MARLRTSHNRFSSLLSRSRTSLWLCIGLSTHPLISRLCLSSASRHSAHSSGISVRTLGERSSQLALVSVLVPVPDVRLVDDVAAVRPVAMLVSLTNLALAIMLTSLWPDARIVPPPSLGAPFEPYMLSSSSAISANGSGSISSGGRRETQHIFSGSNFMSPKMRAAGALANGDEATDEPVKCEMRAGRWDDATASKSRNTPSLPSHRDVRGFHVISPTVLGLSVAPRLRIRLRAGLRWRRLGFLSLSLSFASFASFDGKAGAVSSGLNDVAVGVGGCLARARSNAEQG